MHLNHIDAGSGPPVVLLHGLFGSARNFGTIQRALAPRFRVIAMDARNHGGSPHAQGMRYEDLAGDVAETLDRLGIRRTAIIGHSMGGKTAMTLALTAPDRVGRLMVADIAPVAYQHENETVAGAMRAIPLRPALTRAEAEAVLADAVPVPGVRTFSDPEPSLWRRPAVAHRAGGNRRRHSGSGRLGRPTGDLRRAGPVRHRRRVRLRPARAPAGHPRVVSRRSFRQRQECRPLAPRR